MTVAERSGHAGAWGWFCVWATVGVLCALGFLEAGWLLLGPVLLVVIALMATGREIRRAAFGLALGGGLALSYFAYLERDRAPGVPLLEMGVSLVIVGVLEQIRRTYVAPRVRRHPRHAGS